jgi:hypothetical protein
VLPHKWNGGCEERASGAGRSRIFGPPLFLRRHHFSICLALAMFSPPPKRRHRQHSTIEQKLDAIGLLEVGESQSTVASVLGTPESTLQGWWSQRERLREFNGSRKRKTMGGQGRHELFPFSADLKKHMMDQRDEEKVRMLTLLLFFTTLTIHCLHIESYYLSHVAVHEGEPPPVAQCVHGHEEKPSRRV